MVKDKKSGDSDQARASKGGIARAKKLSPAERKEIAIGAAEARWGKTVPTASFGSPDKPLSLAGVQIQCYVLDDGRRVLVQRGIQSGIGMSTSGGSGGAGRLARFVASLEARGLETDGLSGRLSNPILFRSPSFGGNAFGYEATVFVEVCEAVRDAGRQGLLVGPQMRYAKQCDILLSGMSRTAIIALVDEATGFQAVREQDALAKFLEAYIQKELRKWVKTFPREFFTELCRLKGVTLSPDMRLPGNIGKAINDLVYDRLGPGIREELNRRNPVTETGRRRHKHHQYLTEHVGHPKLLHHLGKLIGLAYGFDDGDYEGFYARVNKVLPVQDTLPLFAQANAAADAAGARALRAGNSD